MPRKGENYCQLTKQHWFRFKFTNICWWIFGIEHVGFHKEDGWCGRPGVHCWGIMTKNTKNYPASSTVDYRLHSIVNLLCQCHWIKSLIPRWDQWGKVTHGTLVGFATEYSGDYGGQCLRIQYVICLVISAQLRGMISQIRGSCWDTCEWSLTSWTFFKPTFPGWLMTENMHFVNYWGQMKTGEETDAWGAREQVHGGGSEQSSC